MAGRRRLGACALVISGALALAFAADAQDGLDAGAGVGASVGPAAVAPPPIELPAAPQLAEVARPTPPPSFCSEIDRGKFLAEIFNPAVQTSNDNVAKANAHLDALNQVVATSKDGPTQGAARAAFAAYQPVSTQAYQSGLDILAMRPAIMATPVRPCASQPTAEVQAQASLPPPRASGPSALDPAPQAALTGPKRTVAVGAIQGSGGFEKSEDWSAGPALQAMLTKALYDKGRVIVVERNQLDQVLNEQQLQASHVTGGNSNLYIKMIPAQYLVLGSVTEFGSPNKGNGFSIGTGQGDFIGGLGIQRQTGKVTIDIRILNTRTAQVINSFSVTRTVSQTHLALTGGYNGVSAGTDSFSKTPLGEASRQALDEAADRIADFLAQAGWEAKVAATDGDQVFINAGSEAGLASGARLRIEHIGRVLTDPDTGEVLSEDHQTLGDVVIEGTQPKVSHGRFMPTAAGAAPQRGDLATLE
ncbi:MAG TPA: CsgG/HfaB family protein [Caulobacteraceae bacterium]|nr:CsgG/HfaB family protein [Caulobacteraceae bacterium]